MKCPHQLEPHQIQGLDAIHIFPVIQWLVKKALETREEFVDETRNFTNFLFHSYYSTPQQEKIKESWPTVSKTISEVQVCFVAKFCMVSSFPTYRFPALLCS
ncbi:coiled-coil domain-containing protein 93-like [Penaeus monodon]|uniref:coiled-coil domain-containing protein 93-like n=1 Tax=Penaeus monodon TaxID=6687 RepID=UPI0018A70981|nr:coiled-coil domain-containing protein 93-like [Penaeus monodon]